MRTTIKDEGDVAELFVNGIQGTMTAIIVDLDADSASDDGVQETYISQQKKKSRRSTPP